MSLRQGTGPGRRRSLQRQRLQRQRLQRQRQRQRLQREAVLQAVMLVILVIIALVMTYIGKNIGRRNERRLSVTRSTQIRSPCRVYSACRRSLSRVFQVFLAMILMIVMMHIYRGIS